MDRISVFDMGGQTYGIGKIPVWTQFHVSRRLLPVLASMGISVSMLAKGARMAADDLIMVAAPAADVVSRMQDDDIDYILEACLAVVQRKHGPKESDYSKVYVGARQLAYEDIDMGGMIRLVVEVLRLNMVDFLKGLPEQPSSESSSNTTTTASPT